MGKIELTLIDMVFESTMVYLFFQVRRPNGDYEVITVKLEL